MLKKIITAAIIFSTVIICKNFVFAANDLAQKLSGKILLQVESHGEAWHVNPKDQKRYGLGHPYEAFSIMRQLGIGITNSDLNKISVGSFTAGEADNDNDGVPNNAETALGTDPNSKDSDNDGYDDLAEITNGYNPLSSGRLPINNNFTKLHLGKIFLQVESRGEAWYIEPVTQKRYFLGRPTDAFQIMRTFGLGITNADLEKITVGLLPITIITPPINPTATTTGDDIIYSAAAAIRAKNKTLTASYFVSEMKKSIEYNLDNMSDESILALGNILSGSKLTSSTATEKIYTNEVYFSLGGYNVLLKFYIKKQSDGNWLMTNL